MTIISDFTQKQAKQRFYQLGVMTWNRPCWLLAGAILVCLISSIGLIYFEEENRSEYIWVPRDSWMWSNFMDLKDSFGDPPRSAEFIVRVKDSSKNLLTPNLLDEAYDAYLKVTRFSGYNDGKVLKLEDVCTKTYETNENGTCLYLYRNYFALFDWNRTNWNTQEKIDNTTRLHASLIPEFLGSYVLNPTTVSAKAIRMYFGSQVEAPITSADIEAWEKSYQDSMPDLEADGLTFVWQTARSISDETARVVSEDIPIFLGACLLMLVYLIFTLGRFDKIRARPWLASIMVILMAMSLVFGISTASVFGVEFVFVCMLVGYILLGVGVDDMIIITDIVSTTTKLEEETDAERMGRAFSHAGLTITLTSLSSVAAFLSGATVDMLGIRSFCLVAAAAFFANFLYQMMIFTPLLGFDERRIAARRNFCCCCCVKHDDDDDDSETDLDSIRSSDQDLTSRLVGKTMIPVLQNRIGRWSIIITAITVLVLSCVSLMDISRETNYRILVPNDSFVIDYLDELDEYFGSKDRSTGALIINHEDFSQNETRSRINHFVSQLETRTDVTGSIVNWMNPFQSFLRGKNLTMENLTSTQFYTHAAQFVKDDRNRHWSRMIRFDDAKNPKKIAHSQFIVYFELSGVNPLEAYDNLIELDDIIEENNFDGFVFAAPFLNAYLANTILRLTIENMVFAVIGVTVVLSVLLPFKLAVLIVLVVAMVDFDMFGWMWVFGIDINGVSYMNLVMGVGLAVDYLIHIAHVFVDVEPKDPSDVDERIKITMESMGPSVLKGAFSTFLGCITLAFSNSYAFRTFFKMFLGIIILALWHGMFFLPALMAEIWVVFGRSKVEDTKQDDSEPEVAPKIEDDNC